MNNRSKNREIISFLRREFLQSHENEGHVSALREARIFEHILEKIPIYCRDGELIAGDFGWHDSGEPEFSRFFTNIPKTAENAPVSSSSPEEEMHREFHCFGNYTPAHTCVDYGKLLRLGIEGIIMEVMASQKEVKNSGSAYLEAIKVALEALLKYCARITGLLEQTLSEGKGASESLKRLMPICRNVPLHPAASFHEALQSVWFLHSMIGVSEYCDSSISLGNFDQYIYPFFRKSLEAGTGIQEMEEMLHHFFVKLNRYGDAACTINLGGMDKDGNDLCNSLTEMIIRVFSKGDFASPILAARIHPGIPQTIFDSLTTPKLFAKGQPTFYGEISCRKALAERGVPAERINGWSANSCMGLVIQGAEISDMWGAVVNFLLPLELALNGGAPLCKNLPIKLKTSPSSKYANFAELKSKFLEYLSELTAYCVNNSRIHLEQARKDRQNPFVSSFIESCIARGQDRLSGGADYHTVIVEAFGLINASDALLAIEQLVFKRKKYSLARLLEAVNANFAGCHHDILKEILKIPKYGNGYVEADKPAAELADHFADIVSSFSEEGTVYAPSFHTLNVHISAGHKYGASLDGRLSGDPLAKNIGTSPGKSLKGHTSLMRSAATINQTKFSGGQALDISLDSTMLRSVDSMRKFQALLSAYFEMGGLQVQVNGISADILRAAVKEPDKHRDLIVRIAGYSSYFTRLEFDNQQEMILRFEKGL